MLEWIVCFLICGAHFAAGINPGPKYPPSKGELWPKPQFQQKDNKYYFIDTHSFKIKFINHKCSAVSKAIDRYSFYLRRLKRIQSRYQSESSQQATHVIHDVNFQGYINTLVINITSPCEENAPSLEMNEYYYLSVLPHAITISANSSIGTMRALESLLQLKYLRDDLFVQINHTHIHDYPRYPHRGLLIDTSRHFLSLNTILNILDSMAANKMNVLHWHIVDDQSFPYQSERFPELSRLGAYHRTMVYTKADIELVIRAATSYGIRVIPEFDVPGHTRSWGEAYPELLTQCYKSGKPVSLGPMDPTRNYTYTFLQQLFGEIQGLFVDKYFHIGGDEVELDCWDSNPTLQRYMKQHNLTRIEDLHALFMTNVIPLLANKSNIIAWQEVFDEKVQLPKNSIIHVWKSQVMEMESILKSGYRLIYSTSWYLDHLKDEWQNFYIVDPRAMLSHFNGFDKNINLGNIIGGEACMWGEMADETNVMSRVWPRASAVAEKLWSPESASLRSIPPEVFSRLEEHTCRMIRRGIPAQPPSGPGYCVNFGI